MTMSHLPFPVLTCGRCSGVVTVQAVATARSRARGSRSSGVLVWFAILMMQLCDGRRVGEGESSDDENAKERSNARNGTRLTQARAFVSPLSVCMALGCGRPDDGGG